MCAFSGSVSGLDHCRRTSIASSVAVWSQGRSGPRHAMFAAKRRARSCLSIISYSCLTMPDADLAASDRIVDQSAVLEIPPPSAAYWNGVRICCWRNWATPISMAPATSRTGPVVVEIRGAILSAMAAASFGLKAAVFLLRNSPPDSCLSANVL